MNIAGYSRNFWLLCFGLFFFMTSFNLLLPELNSFVSDLGGKDLKWITIFLFTITAALSRPFSGKLSDTIGRKRVMTIGMTIGLIAGLLYPLSSNFGSLALIFYGALRLLHGMSAGFLPTGATALVTDILPPDKRGVGMGIWGVFSSLGIGGGQFMASWIENNYGMTSLFFVGSGFAAITIILTSFISETLPKKDRKKFSFSLLKIKMDDIIEPHVIPAAIVMFCSTISSGLVFVITQDHCEFINIDNKGLFFLYYMIATIVVRLFASGLSDKIGRRKTLVFGFFLMIASMTVMSLANDLTMFIIGSVIFGLSTGINSPTMFAWNADLSPVHRRGVGAGTLFIALEFGIMMGSLSTSLTYNNTFESLKFAYLIGALFSVISIIYLLIHMYKKPNAELIIHHQSEDSSSSDEL